MSVAPPSSRRFDIALSFPGEHRATVGAIAEQLASTFSKERVLYDRYHDAEFARLDLDVYLPALYRLQSELIVLFLCPEYAKKRWCGLECRFIRQLIGTPDAKRIMFLSFGNPGDLSDLGILGGDGYIDILPLTPQAVTEKILTRLRLNQGATGRHSALLPVSTGSRKIDISRIIKYAPAELIGREAETKLLTEAWDQAIFGESKRPRVVTFVALGGEGKTSLVANWAADLAIQDWPGCDAVLAWSFYSQGTREQTAVSSDTFLAEALTFFGDAEMADSAAGAFDKGRRLAHLVGGRRALLILDGLEPLQYSPTSPTPGELKDQGLAALLKGLASNNNGLCVVTTRYAVHDLRGYWRSTAPSHDLPRLSTAAGVLLLRTIGVKTGSQAEFQKLVEAVDGHALTLQILGQLLVRAFHGDIRRRDRIDLGKANEKIQGGHAFRAMEAYVKWMDGNSDEARREVAILKLLGLFDRPATADCVDALRQAPAIPGLTEALVGLAEDDWEFSVASLRDARLLAVNREEPSGELIALDAHPLLREYFAQRVRQEQPEAWRAAHRRLHEHLCATTPDKPEPKLHDLEPLHQAVAHGCHAGMFLEAQTVLRDRIQRVNEYYSVNKLGAVGGELSALACFFQTTWSRVTTELPPERQSLVLNQAAIDLRSVGRLTESREPTLAVLEMDLEQKNWRGAAVSFNNLSELELTMGEVTGAVEAGAQSVVYADRSGNSHMVHECRCTHADALHQAGRRAEAEACFREAEKMQADRQPAQPLLYSIRGFRHCDLLLAEAERAAWRHRSSRQSHASALNLVDTCRAVEQRAAQTLAWMQAWPPASLLTVAVDHLTLGRAAFYAVVLSSDPASLVLLPPSAFAHLATALDGLRRAGTQDQLPHALLTHAWVHSLTGAQTGPESAQDNLDEAWEIAERGPMRLFLAGIHLHRARLFGPRIAEEPYPWGSPHEDLRQARALIEKCGYWRRKEELEDAETAARDWPGASS